MYIVLVPYDGGVSLGGLLGFDGDVFYAVFVDCGFVEGCCVFGAGLPEGGVFVVCGVGGFAGSVVAVVVEVVAVGGVVEVVAEGFGGGGGVAEGVLGHPGLRMKTMIPKRTAMRMAMVLNWTGMGRSLNFFTWFP